MSSAISKDSQLDLLRITNLKGDGEKNIRKHTLIEFFNIFKDRIDKGDTDVNILMDMRKKFEYIEEYYNKYQYDYNKNTEYKKLKETINKIKDYIEKSLNQNEVNQDLKRTINIKQGVEFDNFILKEFEIIHDLKKLHKLYNDNEIVPFEIDKNMQGGSTEEITEEAIIKNLKNYQNLNVRSVNNHYTPLMIAISKKHYQLIKALLEHDDVNISILDFYDWSALRYFIYSDIDKNNKDEFNQILKLFQNKLEKMNKGGMFTSGDKEGVRGLIQYDEDNKYQIIEDILENKVNPENKENIIEFIKFIIPIYKNIDCKFINTLIRKDYFDIFKEIKDDVEKCINNNLDSFIKLSIQVYNIKKSDNKEEFVKYLVSKHKNKIKLINLLIRDNKTTDDSKKFENYSKFFMEIKEEKWVELETLQYLFKNNKYSLIEILKNNINPKLLNENDLPVDDNDDGDVSTYIGLVKVVKELNNEENLKKYYKTLQKNIEDNIKEILNPTDDSNISNLLYNLGLWLALFDSDERLKFETKNITELLKRLIGNNRNDLVRLVIQNVEKENLKDQKENILNFLITLGFNDSIDKYFTITKEKTESKYLLNALKEVYIIIN